MAGLLGQEEGFARASVMIAKAAAIPQAIMDIQKAIAGAVKAGASEPFPANIAAIAAGVAAVAGQTAGVISSIKGANYKANLGGVVPGIGNTDTVPTMLTPGELVIPKQITPTFFDLMKNTSSGGESSGGVQEILIKIQPEEFADFITTEITNRQRANAVLGI